MPKETPQQYRERKERREKLLQSYKDLNKSKYSSEKQNLETADSNTSGNDAGSSKEAKPPPNH